MAFTLDSNLIENDQVEITTDSNNNLAIKHVPTGVVLTVDESAKLSSKSNTGHDHSGEAIIPASVAAGEVRAKTFVTLDPQTAAPSSPSAGDVALADGTNWDPDADGNAEKVIYNGTSWVEDVDLGTSL